MGSDDQLADIARTIQLAVAPVFLLTALGTILGVLTTRLSRVVDRTRVLTARIDSTASSTNVLRTSMPPNEELATLARRRNLVNRAITCATIAALLVCSVVLLAFLGFMLDRNFSRAIAMLFIAAMTMFIAALTYFLREIIITVSSIQTRER
jgi:hypothetical protein